MNESCCRGCQNKSKPSMSLNIKIQGVFFISISLFTTFIEDNVQNKCWGFRGCLHWQHCALFLAFLF
jgi:hypothetical protein